MARRPTLAAFGLIASIALGTLATTGCRNVARNDFEQEASALVCEWNRNFRSLTDIASPDDYFPEWPLDETCETVFLDERIDCNDCEFDAKKARKCLKQLGKVNDVTPEQLAALINGGGDVPDIPACRKVYDCPGSGSLIPTFGTGYAACHLGLECSVGDGRGGEGAMWLLALWLFGRRRRRG